MIETGVGRAHPFSPLVATPTYRRAIRPEPRIEHDDVLDDLQVPEFRRRETAGPVVSIPGDQDQLCAGAQRKHK
jgi:hypothetical protein